MNSVSIPSRPVSRARSARSVTVASTVVMRPTMLRPPGRTARRASGSRRRAVGMRGLAVGVRRLRRGVVRGAGGRSRRRGLVGPVAVLAVEVAGLVLGVALALALHADPEDHVQQPDRRARPD